MIRANAVAAIFVVGVASTSLAQQAARNLPEATLRDRSYLGFGGMPAACPKSALLRRPGFQEEIELSPDQEAKFQQLQRETKRRVDAMMAEFRERRNNLNAQGAAQEVVRALNAEMSSTLQAHQTELENAESRVLDRRQRARLDQIQLQVEGPIAFTRPDFQVRLNMSPDQIAEIVLIVSQSMELMLEASKLSTDKMDSYMDARRSAVARGELEKSKAYKSEVESGRQAVGRLRKTTMQRIGKVLTRKQRQNYEKMLGEPCDLSKLGAARSSRGTSTPKTEKEGEKKEMH